MAPVIRFENVSKRYRLGTRLGDLREFVPDPLAAARRWWRRRNGDAHDEPEEAREVWALKDVSFEVEEGGALGIIGPNGAGKSTILKLLAGITEPTSGRIETRGRVSALIEVGAGFHPDLTGRENVHLNGSILGLSRREIDAKFDSIVEFAELERFIDTPVKRYSSGMYVRLGFSVAMQLEPDVLLVDEVLAVGDVHFRRKCIAAMREFRERAKALLFISHNMAAVTGLCPRCIWLESGEIRMAGDAGDVTARYLAASRYRPMELESRIGAGSGAWGSGEIRVLAVELHGRNGPTEILATGDRLRVEIAFESKVRAGDVLFWVCLVDADGVKVTGSTSARSGVNTSIVPGKGRAACVFSDLTLSPGRYSVTVGIFDRVGWQAPYHRFGSAAQFQVVSEHDAPCAGALGPEFDGLLHVASQWSVDQPRV